MHKTGTNGRKECGGAKSQITMDRHHRSRGRLGQPPAPKEETDLPSPGSDIRFEDVFDFPCIKDENSVDYLSHHGRIMFIVRGLPGTGKHTLSSMITEKYPNCKICCADDYFSQPFAPKKKNSESLKESHIYCHEEAKTACEKNKHPIIIQNSNIRKWEIQFYIDLAIEHCYTVVMVITTRKVACTPEVLEKTNTQGLKKDYFRQRVKQWVEVIPEFTGWVSCPADIACVMTEAHRCMDLVMQMKDFSEIFHAIGEGSPKDFFVPEYFPFCLAAYCNHGANPLARKYYLSRSVQQVYGKVFQLVIQAFVVTQSLMAAVVHLDEDMQKLILENKGFDPQDASDLSHVLHAFNVHSGVKAKQPVTDFAQDSQKTIEFYARRSSEKIDTKDVSFIVLSTAYNKSLPQPCIRNALQFSHELFSSVADSDGFVSFNTTHNGVKYCKLSHGSLLIVPHKEMYLKSVFTGLYV